MKIFLDCLPCILRQVLEASRMSTQDVELQSHIMMEAITLLGDYTAYRNSPEIAREMHQIVKNHTGVVDPYQTVKENDIQTALRLLPQLRQCLDTKQDRIYWALKIAATGNVLDSAINTGLNLEKCLESELNKPFAICNDNLLRHHLEGANTLLIIGDNAGETVFDCVLLEELPPQLDVIYAVRNAPIINDATIDDARKSGIDQYACIISTGCDTPGVILDECSQVFLEAFYKADIVISKGQGNYETLSDCTRDIYFLLKAKCHVLSELLQVCLNDYVFMYHNGKACAGDGKPTN